MKKLSTYLFLIFFSFQTSSLADDIRDFQIEGMSVGDSLLDFFSEEEIKNNIIKDYYKYKSNKKFITVEFNELSFFKTYKDGVQIDLKNEKKYEIYGLSGHIWYKENIDDCYEKQNEIDKELSKIFKEAKREYVSKIKHPADESGKSNVTYITYWFKSGDYASIDCTDWSSKMKPRKDNLGVLLVTKEFNDWMRKKD
jgi:hypothetical protein